MPVSRYMFTAPVEGLPDEIEVLHTGKFNHPAYGSFEITERDLDELVENQHSGVQAGIDVDHKGARGDTRAAGWIKSLERVGDALRAKIDWTRYGRDLLENREYAYVSAEYGLMRDDTTGKMLPTKRLKATTLTNRPFLKSLKPIVKLSDELLLDTACPMHPDEPDPNCPACDDEQMLCDALDEITTTLLATGSIGGTTFGELPKSSFAYIDSAGNPHLPYKDKNGKVNASHVRNALARLNQVKGLSGATLDRVRRKLEDALRSVGGHPGSDDNQGDTRMTDQVRSILRLSDDADDEAVIEAVRKLADLAADAAVSRKMADDAQAAIKEARELAEANSKELREMRRDAELSAYARDGKIDPKEMDHYRALMDAAPEQTKALLEAKPRNPLFLSVGHGNDSPDDPEVDAIGRHEHRLDLAKRADQLLAEGKAKSIGEALVMAERGVA